jgi:6-phosphogluconate dehydrogenase
MPGGHPDAWPHIKKIFQSIAAQTDGQPCCDWVGEEGAGHYVKMVHNGIEYGDMQLISEVLSTVGVGVDDVGVRHYETRSGDVGGRNLRSIRSLE